MMRKITAFLMTAALALTLCACGGQQQETDSESSTEISAESSRERSAVPVKEQSKDKEESKDKKDKEESKDKKDKEESKKESSESEESKKDTSKTEVSEKSEAVSEVSAESSTEQSAEESSQTEESSEDTESSLTQESSQPEVTEPSNEESQEESSEVQESKPAPKPQKPVSGETVNASWFDDAVFVGDSVTLKLSYYADNGSLGNATFLCAGSLGYNNAQMGLYEEGNVHPVLNGETVTVVGGLTMLQPEKIFIMLGMNDIGLYGVDGAVEGMKQLTSQISQNCPNSVIYVQSVTPMLADMQLTDLNNRTIAEFDSKIQPICQERGYIYLDVASAVDDGNGNLIYDYCGDPQAMGLHFSDAGCDAWVNYLKTHV